MEKKYTSANTVHSNTSRMQPKCRSTYKNARNFQSLKKGKQPKQQQLVGFSSSSPSASSSAGQDTSSAGPSTAGLENQSTSYDASCTASAPSTPSVSRSSSQSFYFDTIDDETQQKADESLARAIYATGSTLSLTSNVYWQRFFKVIRPAYSPPTRHALDTNLLEAEYVRVQDKVNEAIQNADCIAVISDGWSNIRGEGIINYILSTPKPVFYKSTDTKDKRHTAAYIADELINVITELGSHKVFALVTDNAANMKAAWVIVKDTFPHITPIGCAAHGLNLLLGDIMGLQTMQTLYKKAKKVVKHVKNRQVISATFSAKQKQKKKATTSLQLPSKTRWGGTVIMYNSLVEGKESLQELAIMESLDVDADIRKVLLDNDVFWARIINSLKVLEPVASAIEKIESDEALLSDVQRSFADLKKKITDALPESPLLQAEERSVAEFIGSRHDFCIKPIHAAANMLDPKCRGSDLDDEQINDAYGVISALARHLHLDEGKVLASLAKFRAKDGLWKGEAVWSSAEHISSATWWKGLCSSEAISPIASVVLQIPPTSAASERNWSMFGMTHTKLRNRLTNERVDKLVAIRSNLKLFEPTQDVSTQLESDEDTDIVLSSAESEDATTANDN